MFCSAEKSEHLLAALRTIGLNEMGYWASWMTALFVPCTVSALLAVVRPTAAAVLLPNPTSRLPCSPLHPPVCLLPTPPSCLALLAAEPLRVTPAAHRLGARHPAVHQVPNLDPVLGHAALPAGESWLTAAIPMENPYCGCKLTRVRSCCSLPASGQSSASATCCRSPHSTSWCAKQLCKAIVQSTAFLLCFCCL